MGIFKSRNSEGRSLPSAGKKAAKAAGYGGKPKNGSMAQRRADGSNIVVETIRMFWDVNRKKK